jgi:molybdenum cofactor cytidylyltransferase
MPDPSCAAIILAAGGSKRLGEAKQLLKFHGESLVHRTVRLALESECRPVLVVTGAYSDEVKNDLSGLPVEIVFNAEWQRGMGGSLRCAAKELSTRPRLESILILVCDQPMLNSLHLKALIRAQHQHQAALVASRYSGRLGVPAIFSSSELPMLMECSGDTGARAILEARRESIVSIDFPDGAVDVDTPEDLQHLWQSLTH